MKPLFILTSSHNSFAKTSVLVFCISIVGESAVFRTRAGDVQRQSLSVDQDSTAEDRAATVKEALEHLWQGYKSSAWGEDEVRPINGGAGGHWGDIGMNILDSMDTLWLAGFKSDFAEGEKWVSALDFSDTSALNLKRLHQGRSSFFETTIRALGGLLSSHALSGRDVYLQKARALGANLFEAFPQPRDPHQHAWPDSYINLFSPHDIEVTPSWRPGSVAIADAASNALEFSYLSQATGDERFGNAADKVLHELVNMSVQNQQPCAPSLLDAYSLGFVTSSVSVGAYADSYFEYLLKRYIQGGNSDVGLLNAWKSAMQEMRTGLVRTSSDGFTFLAREGNRDGGSLAAVDQEMDHLSCFMGGLLALGHMNVAEKDREDWWLPTGAAITRTCYEMYHRTASGLSPETVSFDNGMQPLDRSFRLRPETLEALFYMYRATGNHTYREWSWNIFQAINKHTRSKYGFAKARDVTTVPVPLDDSEETFMGAETLKYALLIQLPSSALPLDQWVLNTEAHPLPIRHAIDKAERHV